MYRQRVNTCEHKAPRSRPAGAAAVLLHVKQVSCTVRGACQKQIVHTSKRLSRPPPSALDGVPENTVNNGPEWSPEMICPRWHTRGRHSVLDTLEFGGNHLLGQSRIVCTELLNVSEHAARPGRQLRSLERVLQDGSFVIIDSLGQRGHQR